MSDPLEEMIAAGRHAEAARAANRRIATDPGDALAWQMLAVAMAAAGGAEQVFAGPVSQREDRFGDGFSFIHDVALRLFLARNFAAVDALAVAAPAGTALSLPPLYFAACHRLRSGDTDGGFALLHRLRADAAALGDSLPGEDENLGVMLRHAFLVEDARFLDDPGLDAAVARTTAKLEAITWHRDASADGPLVVAACDARYLALYGVDFATSLAAKAPGAALHLHLVDPAADSEAVIDALPATPGWSSERSGALRSSAFYASARFVRLEELLDHYRRPLMLVDIDTTFVADPGPVFDALAGCDAAGFEKPDHIGPASRYPAVLTAFADGRRARRLGAFLRRFILAKLTLPAEMLWLVDQAALYTARHLPDGIGPGARWADLNAALGGTFETLVRTQPEKISKKALMEDAGRRG